MSSIASWARRRGAWRAASYGVGGYVLAAALLAGSPESELFAGNTSSASVAVIGPLGGLAGTTLASRRYRNGRLRSHDLALFWCAVTTVIVIATYVYLRVDQASTATGLITGAAGLRVMRIALMERSAGPAGLVSPPSPHIETAASTSPMTAGWPARHHDEMESQEKMDIGTPHRHRTLSSGRGR